MAIITTHPMENANKWSATADTSTLKLRPVCHALLEHIPSLQAKPVSPVHLDIITIKINSDAHNVQWGHTMIQPQEPAGNALLVLSITRLQAYVVQSHVLLDIIIV
jgi:hypothetical protein